MTKEEAIEILEERKIEPVYKVKRHIEYVEKLNTALDMAIEALQTPPITQRSMYQAGYRQGREDRPRGHWVDGKWCSVCGMPIATDVWGTSVDESEVHYCIECGADMRGEHKERSE